MKKSLWVWILFYLLLIISPGAQAGLIQKIAGEWKGSGYQYDGANWSIAMVVQSDGTVTIAYPSLKCGGTLTLLEESDAGALFREHLRYRKECINRGTVRLIQVKPNHLEFFWYLPNGELQAKGELVPTKNSPIAPRAPTGPVPFHGPK
jgi:hypothetical protein